MHYRKCLEARRNETADLFENFLHELTKYELEFDVLTTTNYIIFMEEEATWGVNEDMPCLEFSAKSSEGNHGDSNYLPSIFHMYIYTVYTTVIFNRND